MKTLMYEWAKDLFPINRSLTGDGVRETLRYIKAIIPELQIKEVASMTKCFDWSVPFEWNCKNAYILTPDGKKICDFKEHNLHIMGYSIPVDKEISFNELKEHLYFIKELPNAIPYITSYYKQNWGFCIKYNDFLSLKDGIYKVKIESELKKGHMTYADLLIRGKSKKEIFLSTYICHPSMANNEISGPVVTMELIRFIQSLKKRKYTYRVVFIPETIGSIYYISQNLKQMKKNIIAGFNITTIGDDLSYSFVASRYENTLADKVAKFVLKGTEYTTYSYLQRGSDERQYCFDGVDLPVVTICRSKYHTYKEYHTSLDDLNFISEAGLLGGFDKLKKAILTLEKNEYYKVTTICEPCLGKRGLYPSISTKDTAKIVNDMLNFIAYADGKNDIIDIANIINTDFDTTMQLLDMLLKAGVVKIYKKHNG